MGTGVSMYGGRNPPERGEGQGGNAEEDPKKKKYIGRVSDCKGKCSY